METGAARNAGEQHLVSHIVIILLLIPLPVASGFQDLAIGSTYTRVLYNICRLCEHQDGPPAGTAEGAAGTGEGGRHSQSGSKDDGDRDHGYDAGHLPG